MDSNITINIVEPGSSTPIDPVVPSTNGTIDTISTPDTGLFTNGIGAKEATIISIALVLVILATVVTILYYRNKKQGKITKLTQLVSKYKYILAHKKATTIGLTTLAIVVSLGTLAGLLKLGVSAIDSEVDNQANTQTTQQVDTETSAAAEVTNGEITIELGDEPVFAVIPTTVTVTEDMPAGYTLKAYSANPTLSAEGTDKTIDLVTTPEDGLENAGSLTAALTDNTWGLAVEKPESQEQEIYFSLPETADEAVTIAAVEDMEAEGSDTVTVYYGIYITPDLPYGTYTGASVSYEIEDNSIATVIFDGNGLYFEGDQSKTANVVKYKKAATDKTVVSSHTPNVNDEGAQDGLYPLGLDKTFVYSFDNAATVHVDFVKMGTDGTCALDENDFFSFWAGSHPDYTAKVNYAEGIQAFGNTTGKYIFAYYASQSDLETDIAGDTVTIGYTTSNFRDSYCGNPNHGYGYYATITAVDAGGNPAYAIGNVPNYGEYKTPATTVVADYEFLGWSTDPNAVLADYADGNDVSINLALSKGESTTLYAVWSPIVDITYDGNNATAGSMESTSYNSDGSTTVTLAHEDIMVDDTVNLLAPNYKKDGYGFAGWSTDADAWDDLTDSDESNDPTIYGPNQTFTMTKDIALTAEDGNLILYAVWIPAEEENGSPVYLQSWQGCSNLTATIYSNGVLTVARNTITALTDSRDGNVYTVARLADGNCWTTENLRLDNSTTYVSTTSELSSANTNNPSLPLTNVSGPPTSNRLSISSNDWCSDYNAQCNNQSIINSANNNIDREDAIASHRTTFSSSGTLFQWYSYGSFYNWYSATAGNGKYETNSNVTVAGDICPAGWHLPYGGTQTSTKGGNTSGGFYYLNQQMGGGTSSTDSNNWRSFPNNFIVSGRQYGSYSEDRDSNGYYWSSTAYSDGSAYNLRLSRGGMHPGNDDYGKQYGFSVRCVAPAE